MLSRRSDDSAAHRRSVTGPVIVTLVLLLIGRADAGDRIDYTRQIKPLLERRCYACHGALKQKAGLRVDTGLAIRKGGDSGPAVEAGHADLSLLLERVTESDPALRMPPEGGA